MLQLTSRAVSASSNVHLCSRRVARCIGDFAAGLPAGPFRGLDTAGFAAAGHLLHFEASTAIGSGPQWLGAAPQACCGLAT